MFFYKTSSDRLYEKVLTLYKIMIMKVNGTKSWQLKSAMYYIYVSYDKIQ